MNGIKIANLVASATTIGHRTYLVQTDPAVQKAVGDAGADIATAAKSIAKACFEIRSAWIRTAPRSTFGLAA